MRLTCPNCGAQYEVPDEVIPVSGRDVQCSNCGGTWFQRHPSDPAIEADDEGGEGFLAEGDDLSDTPEDREVESRHSPGVADRSATEQDEFAQPDAGQADPAPSQDDGDGYRSPLSSDPDSDAESADSHEPQSQLTPTEGAAPAPGRRPLDPDVARVLREEAARESAVRAAESVGGLESQPDLGLGEPDSETARRDREARQRMARMRGLPDQELDAGAAGSRRDLLPDIEEINSSLRSTSDRRDRERAEIAAAPETVQRQRNGFRLGFSLVLLTFAILALLYVFAPQLADAVPALSDALQSYVAAVNALRLWLDGQLAALMVWLDGIATPSID